MFPVAISRLSNLGDCFVGYLSLSKLSKMIICYFHRGKSY